MELKFGEHGGEQKVLFRLKCDSGSVSLNKKDSYEWLSYTGPHDVNTEQIDGVTYVTGYFKVSAQTQSEGGQERSGTIYGVVNNGDKCTEKTIEVSQDGAKQPTCDCDDLEPEEEEWEWKDSNPRNLSFIEIGECITIITATTKGDGKDHFGCEVIDGKVSVWPIENNTSKDSISCKIEITYSDGKKECPKDESKDVEVTHNGCDCDCSCMEIIPTEGIKFEADQYGKGVEKTITYRDQTQEEGKQSCINNIEYILPSGDTDKFFYSDLNNKETVTVYPIGENEDGRDYVLELQYVFTIIGGGTCGADGTYKITITQKG